MIWDYARVPQQHQTFPALGQYLVWAAKSVTGGVPPATGIQEKFIGFIANCGQFLTRR